MTTAVAQHRQSRRAMAPYLFIAVPLVYMIVAIFYPAAKEVWTSFTDTSIAAPNDGRFVGVENYVSLIGSGQIWKTLGTTVLYSAGSVVGAVLCGTVGALAINRPFRGRAIARTILTFGWAVPPVATSLIWSWIYNRQSGALNTSLGTLGVPPQGWLITSEWALPAVIATTIWEYSPFVMLVVLAALQSVPEEVQEAARIDGADRLNVFRNVTLPAIMPSIRLVALMVAIWSIRQFEIIFLLTGGGPLKSTSTLVVSLEEAAFQDLHLGEAGTYGVIGLVVSLLLAVVYFLVERRELIRSRA